MLAWVAAFGLAGSCGHHDHATTIQHDAALAAAPGSDAIDRLLREAWRAQGIAPAPAADDAEFLRRASLDLLGRIPTEGELATLQADTSAERRTAAIDRMLASTEQAEHLATQTTDLLLGRALKVPPPLREGTQAWLESQLAADTGWDAIVRAIVTASGEQSLEGPAGFLVAHGRQGRTAALAGETARVFLGASIQCAQCHDHPDDASFTQRDFYAFTAYFARTRARPPRDGSIAILDRGRGEARMPKAGDAPEKPTGEVISPKFFGETVKIAGPRGRRPALADAIVQSEAFPRAYVNRTWAVLFGRGLVEPIEALPARDASNPVLDELTRSFVADGYDTDALLRRIVLSEAYGRSSRSDGPRETIGARVAAFAQADVRALGPEQLLRSFGVVAGLGVEDDELASMLEDKRGALRQIRFVFADDEGAGDGDAESIGQALLLQNSELVQKVVRSREADGLGRTLRTLDDPGERIDAIYRRVLARAPTTEERGRALALVETERHDPRAYEDVVAALLLSSEFLSNH